MKKNRLLLFSTMIALILVSVSVASTGASVPQTDSAIVMVQASTEIPVPETVGEVISNFEAWVGAFIPLVGLTIFLTGLLIRLFKVSGSGIKQFLSWGIGIVLTVVLNLIGIGAPEGLLWYSALIYGLFVSLAANHVFDIGLLNSILEALKLPHKKY